MTAQKSAPATVEHQAFDDSESTQMTPRQRWLALLEGGTPDRIPTDYRATAEVTERLLRELDCPDHETLWRKLRVDYPRSVGPAWKLTHHPDDPLADLWGIRYRSIDYGTGEYSEADHRPLAGAESVADIARHRWPSPDDFDYTTVTSGLEKDDGYRVMIGSSYEPFLLYGYLRGLEQSFEDLLVNPDIADAVLGRLFDFYYEYNRRIFEAAKKAARGKIDIFYLAEDLGGQTGPLMSLEMYRRFLRPNQVKMADLVRSYGIHVFYHTDGAARIFMPDLVDVVGIEVLNPVQWRCPGMEREQLVRDFGDKIIFHGAMDNQQTMPFGSVEDVVAEVKDNVRIFGESGRGWVCAPCHNLQAVTPTRNILVLYDTIGELGADRPRRRVRPAPPARPHEDTATPASTLNVLIVGGAGHVGTIIRPTLEPHYNCYYYDLRAVPGVTDAAAGGRGFVASIEDEYFLRHAMSGMDVVVNLAMGVVPGTVADVTQVDPVFNVNVRGCYKIVAAALSSGVRRIVNASSLSVYNNLSYRGHIDETEPMDAWFPYGMSKRLGEAICEAAAGANPGTGIVSLRMMHPVGEEAYRNRPKQPIRDAAGREMHAFVMGPQDTGRLFAAAIEYTKKPGHHTFQASGDLNNRWFPNTKAERELGWKPRGG